MVQRRLATVLACDVVGYSRMMARDDEGTMSRFATHRALIHQLVAQHRGQLFGAAGDSIYAEFISPVEAVRCAIDVQLALHDIESALAEGERMRWRIGINLGDVMAEEGAVVGDGVNVAARLEALARPGGVCLSAAVAEHVRDHVEVVFEDLGRQRLKNIGRPIQVFRIPLPSDLDPASPYHGLVPFEVGESSMFHGRARAVTEATDRLARRAAEGSAFLLVHGASGVGKSSLVRAGILSTLMRPGAVDGVARWLWSALRPSGTPSVQAALAACLASPEGLGGLGMGVADAEALVEALAAEPDSLLRACGRSWKVPGPGCCSSSTSSRSCWPRMPAAIPVRRRSSAPWRHWQAAASSGWWRRCAVTSITAARRSPASPS